MGKSKKNLVVLILACGILLSLINAVFQNFQSEEPAIVGFFLGDVVETY